MMDSPANSPVRKPLVKRITSHRAFIPVMIFIGVVLIFSFSSQFSERPPEIKSIDPSVAEAGEVLIINGDYFGDVRQGGEVSIAGIRPVSSSYYEWTDKRISVQIPSEAGSGMVTVSTRTGRSNSVLFTNKKDIPVVVEGPSKPGLPYIKESLPATGSAGDLIVVKGINFGEERNAGKVYFSAIKSQLEDGFGSTNQDVMYLQAAECDFDYEVWSENEIQVRVPDGATSGSIYVETDKGKSNSVYFEVIEPVGTKMLTTKRGYQAQYGVSIRNVVSRGENELYIWLPKILLTVNQNKMENTNSPDPYWDYSCQVFVYHFENLSATDTAQITQTYWFDRYGIETRITPSAVPVEYEERRLIREYTKSTEYLPSDNEKITKLVKDIVKWEVNPYRKARLIYSYLLETMEYSDFIPSSSVIEALEFNKADSYIYALLYSTMLRNAGIPSRVNSGYIVYGDKKTKEHFWNEFYIEDFGWIPVDCSLADGARFEDFPYAEDPAGFYFGNIDNQHICTAKGAVQTIQIKPDDRIVQKDDIFPLQNAHEELSTSIQSYRSVWQKLRIIEWW